MQPGHNMVESMERGLAKSRYVCPVISPNSLEAKWPKMEWTIAISSDPSGSEGRVIPLWLGGNIPPSLKIRLVLYFDNDSNSSASFEKLISTLKGEPTAPPGSNSQTTSAAYPEPFPIQYEDAVDEQLLSNLFPTSGIPKIVWHGPTKRTIPQVYEHLNRVFPGTLPTFIVKSEQIFCFWDLNDPGCPFRGILSADVIERDNVEDWLGSADKTRWLVELLNKGLKHNCYKKGLQFDSKHKRYMFLSKHGEDRQISWHAGQRRSRRTVVKKHAKHDPAFWSHQSLRAHFIVLGRAVFLQLDPGWVFTSDGRTPLPKERTSRLSTKWTSHEHNSSMSYHIRFWSSYLSSSSEFIMLDLGGSTCRISTTPGIANMNRGLKWDIMPLDRVFAMGDQEIQGSDRIRDILAETDETFEDGSMEESEDG